jgi:hypothetical protein
MCTAITVPLPSQPALSYPCPAATNNKGVDFLYRGDAFRAYEYFHLALRSNQAEETVARQSPVQEMSSKQRARRASECSYDENFKQLHFIKLYREPLLESTSSENLVYRRGIRFTPSRPTGDQHLALVEERTLLSSIVVFNLALVSHLRSFTPVNSEERTRFLEKSKLLYSNSLDILAHTVDQQGRSDEIKILTEWVSMVACNNAAQICCTLDEQENAKSYLQVMVGTSSRRSRTCTSIQQCSQATNSLSGLLDQWNEMFLLNVLYMDNLVAPPTARAA